MRTTYTLTVASYSVCIVVSVTMWFLQAIFAWGTIKLWCSQRHLRSLEDKMFRFTRLSLPYESKGHAACICHRVIQFTRLKYILIILFYLVWIAFPTFLCFIKSRYLGLKKIELPQIRRQYVAYHGINSCRETQEANYLLYCLQFVGVQLRICRTPSWGPMIMGR